MAKLTSKTVRFQCDRCNGITEIDEADVVSPYPSHNKDDIPRQWYWVKLTYVDSFDEWTDKLIMVCEDCATVHILREDLL